MADEPWTDANDGPASGDCHQPGRPADAARPGHASHDVDAATRCHGDAATANAIPIDDGAHESAVNGDVLRAVATGHARDVAHADWVDGDGVG